MLRFTVLYYNTLPYCYYHSAVFLCIPHHHCYRLSECTVQWYISKQKWIISIFPCTTNSTLHCNSDKEADNWDRAMIKRNVYSGTKAKTKAVSITLKKLGLWNWTMLKESSWDITTWQHTLTNSWAILLDWYGTVPILALNTWLVPRTSFQHMV